MAKFKKTKKKYRNSSGGRGKFKMPADWLSNSLASVIGGGGGAVIGGILANQEIIKPETSGLVMTVGGLVGGAFTNGPTRTAMNGLSGAGAGQMALAYMASRATPKSEPAPAPKADAAPAQVAAQQPAALPPSTNGQAAPVSTPSNAYGGAGSVWSAFRDAAGELEWLDDDGEYGDEVYDDE